MPPRPHQNRMGMPLFLYRSVAPPAAGMIPIHDDNPTTIRPVVTIALRTLPIGTAYAIFTGIGAAGTVALGIIVRGDPAAPGRLIPIGLIVTGIIGLRLFGGD